MLITPTRDLVRQGDVLVTLDDTDARINFNKAANNLANTVRKIKQMYIADDQYNANVQEAKIAYQQALADYQRRSRLQGAAAISRGEYATCKGCRGQQQSSAGCRRPCLSRKPCTDSEYGVRKQPEVLMAAESMREAWVALQRTKVRSPVTGYLAQRNVQVGETIGSGQALMSIIPAEQVWINANFKETQPSGVKIGQKVSIVTDFYGSDVVFNGRVDGIMGTGSAFSVLPAQNATGNWIKVVQRLPVRITLDAEQIKAYLLRIGLSATVRLHETHSQGEALATTQRKPRLTQATHWLSIPPVDNEILNIIKANAM